MDTVPLIVPLIAGGVVVLGLCLLLADRVLLAMEARGWIYWRRTKTLSSLGAELVQEIDPGAQAVRRGMEQERVRKNVRPAEDPPFRVDLDGGTVRIRRPGPPPGSHARVPHPPACPSPPPEAP